MNILAVDTSTKNVSLALKTDSSFEERYIISQNFSPSENLLGEIKRMTEREKLELKDLDLLICTKGPGSFTGLRIAMALMKGIALAGDIPLVSVDTLRAVEYELSSYWKDILVSVMDAKKKKFYYRISRAGKILKEDSDSTVEEIREEIKSYNSPTLITGPDSLLFFNKIKEIDSSLNIFLDTFPERSIAKALIKLGIEKFEKLGPDDIGEGPIYIRRSDAEEMLLKRMGEEK